MDTIYETAKVEGAEVALAKLEERDPGYYNRHAKKLEPDLENLYDRHRRNNPEVYSPYNREDFAWTDKMLLYERFVNAWRAGVFNLPSWVFLGPSNTGKSAWIRYIFRKEILRGEALIINTLEGLEGIRPGKTKLILIEDPTFDHKGTLRLSTGVLEALLSTDQQRDIRVLYKIIRKPPNIPVIIVGNPENLPVELAGDKDITGVLGNKKGERKDKYTYSKDSAEVFEANLQEPRSDINVIREQEKTGCVIPTWDKGIPKSVIKRRIIFWITDKLLKDEAVEHYRQQANALLNPLDYDENKRYNLHTQVSRLETLKRHLSKHGGCWDTIRKPKKNWRDLEPWLPNGAKNPR